MNYCEPVLPVPTLKKKEEPIGPEVLVKYKEKIDKENPFDDSFQFHPTGSRFTCIPPVLDTDEDWICWAVEPWQIEDELLKVGFQTTESQQQYPDCMSYRKDDLNIIVVYELTLYQDWVKATKVCRHLNLLKKEDRKMVHRIICGEE